MAKTNFPGLKQDGLDSPQQIANVVNQVLLGKMNCTLDVTLTASATTTDVTDPRIYATSALIFCPTTANGAAHPMTYFVAANGSATLHHDSDANTDKTGILLILG